MAIAAPVDLEQLACPSASACGMMGPYIVAVLAEAGAREAMAGP